MDQANISLRDTASTLHVVEAKLDIVDVKLQFLISGPPVVDADEQITIAANAVNDPRNLDVRYG